MKLKVVKIKTVSLIGCCVIMAWFLAGNQIIKLNEYMGMRALTFSPTLFFSLFVVSTLLVFSRIHRPSPQSIFVGIFTYFSCVWFFLFFSVSGLSNSKLIFIGAAIFLIPLVLISLSEKYLAVDFGLGLLKRGIFSIRVEFIISLILSLVALNTFQKIGLSFDLIDSYERRLVAREQLGGVSGYLFTMSLNGLSALLGFLATYNRRYIYSLFAFGFVILGFGFVGTKAPIIYTALMMVAGYRMSKKDENLLYFLVFVMTAIMFFAVIEYLIFDFSLIADFYVRRSTLILAQLQMYYLDFIFASSDPEFDILLGFQGITPITFLIGGIYLGDPEINANTVTFLSEFGRNGLFGYIVSLLFLVGVFVFLAHLYAVSKHKVWLAVALIYSLLLLEQNYATAFVSSGIGLCIFLLILFRYQRR